MTISRRQFLRAAGLGLAAAWLTRCGMGNKKPVPDPDRSLMDFEKFHRVWTWVNGLELHSRISTDPVTSDAPAVVLVHGSGLSGRYMIPTASVLTADFRVYVPDLPGFGDSGKPEKILNVPQLADGLIAWMSTIGLDRASLLGNSFGCQIIADLAARYPERVERAILQGPTTPPDERSWFWQFIRWRQNQRYNPASLAKFTSPEYRKAGLRRMFWSFHYQITDRIEDKAPRIKTPVLVVRGEHDPIANQQWCEQIARLCPQGVLTVIPGVAHTLCYTAPVRLARVTRAYINEVGK